MPSCITFARHVDHHTFCHTGWNLDLDNFLAFHNTLAMAMMTFVFDDFAFALACRTYALRLHHAEKALSGARDNTTSVAGGTSLTTAVPLSSRTVAMLADHILAHFEFLGDTGGNLLQREAYLQPKVAATILLVLAASKAAAETSESTTSAKHVAEHREDIVHRESATAESSESTSHVGTVESELVVLLTFLRVVEHIVSLCRLLELLLGLFVAGITVGMVFDGYFTIGFLDVVL